VPLAVLHPGFWLTLHRARSERQPFSFIPIPLAAEQTVLGIIDGGDPTHRGDDLVLLLPGVAAVVGAEHVAPDHIELLPELVLQFPLPLEGQVGRGDDQDPLGQATDFQLLEQQASHDRFARARIIGQQKPDPGQF